MKLNNSNPFLLMTFLYLFVATLAAVQAALIAFGIISSGASSITWVRIHFITLGIMVQAIFGYVPQYLSKTEISTRWDIFLSLNSGFILFFYGRAIMDSILIISGGTLIFIATSLFLSQLISMRSENSNYNTHLFYIFATIFLLTGIIIGTGIWVDWGEPLRIYNSLEAHIHAQNWGFLSLVFAGILLDLYPRFSGKQIDNPDSVKRILVLLTLGGLALVISPWMGGSFAIPIAVFGMIIFIAGTVMLLLNMIKPLKGEKKDIGFYHIIGGYTWIFAPLVFAPFVLLKFGGFQFVEPNAPQALVYGWILQIAIAIIPFILSSVFSDKAKLGGTMFSLITVNLGSLFLWLNIFIREYHEVLQGIAYTLWFLSFIPVIKQTYDIMK